MMRESFKIAAITFILLTGLSSSGLYKYFFTDEVSAGNNEVLKEDLKIRTKSDNKIISYSNIEKKGNIFETNRVISVNEKKDFKDELSYYKKELSYNGWKYQIYKNSTEYRKEKMLLHLENFKCEKDNRYYVRISIEYEK